MDKQVQNDCPCMGWRIKSVVIKWMKTAIEFKTAIETTERLDYPKYCPLCGRKFNEK